MKHSNFDLLLDEDLVREQKDLCMALEAIGGKYSWYDYEKQSWNDIGGGPTIQANLGTGIVDLYVLNVGIEEDDGVCMHCMEKITGTLFEFNWTFVVPGTLSRIIDFLPETKEMKDVGEGELLLLSKSELENIQEFSSIVLRARSGEYMDHFYTFELILDWSQEFSDYERKNDLLPDTVNEFVWYDEVDKFLGKKIGEWFFNYYRLKNTDENEIEIVDKKFFGDKEIHIYDFFCNDGYAIGVLSYEDDKTSPKAIKMIYPKLADVLSDHKLCDHILNYRGLYDLTYKDIGYGDIMVALGTPKSILYDV